MFPFDTHVAGTCFEAQLRLLHTVSAYQAIYVKRDREIIMPRMYRLL